MSAAEQSNLALAFRLVAAALALVVGLGILEVGLRVHAAFAPEDSLRLLEGRPLRREGTIRLVDLIEASADPRLVYRLRPGVRGDFLGARVEINSLGMRDRERPLAKPKGSFRVLGIGDSHLFGWGIEAEHRYLSVLEERLNEPPASTSVEVWNLGVPGYNAVQEVRWLERWIDRAAPDLVVIAYTNNDMDLPNFLKAPENPGSLGRSFLLEWLRPRLPQVFDPTESGGDLRPLTADAATGRFRLPEDRIPKWARPLFGWDNMLAAYERLIDMTRRRGIPLVLLQNPDDYRRVLVGRAQDARPSQTRALAAWCAERGVLVVDPQARILAHLRATGLPAESLWLSERDTHGTPLRNRLVAEALHAALLDSGLVPGPSEVPTP